jgi:hypothetical protein
VPHLLGVLGNVGSWMLVILYPKKRRQAISNQDTTVNVHWQWKTQASNQARDVRVDKE